MKVAFFSSGLGYKLGGPAISEALLVRELRRFIEVEIFVPKESFEYDFVDDYDLHSVVPYVPQELAKLRSKVILADLIHLNGHWKWWYSNISKLAKQNKVPYVLHPRGMLLVGHRKKQMKRVFNFTIGNAVVQGAKKVIALSEFEKRQFVPYGIPDEKIVVIPNPIEVKETKSIERPSLPVGTKDYFIYLGRIERRKNLVFLVRAFKVYKTLGGKTSLLIVGPVERGYDLEVRAAVVEEGLEQHILILPPAYEGERDRFLLHSKALVYPATDEPFGRVPFEAIALGTAPVVPDLSGAAEYVGPYLPECIYRENDLSDLAKTLINVESLESARVNEARKWVKEHLSVVAIGKRVLEVYRSSLQGSIAPAINGNLSAGRFSESSTD